MQIIVLVKEKEAVLDTSVMQLEYRGYCLMSPHLYKLLIFCDMFHLCLLLVNVYTKGPVMSPFPLIHDHPYYRVCPDILSLVGDPLSGNGCGSPNHT